MSRIRHSRPGPPSKDQEIALQIIKIYAAKYPLIKAYRYYRKYGKDGRRGDKNVNHDEIEKEIKEINDLLWKLYRCTAITHKRENDKHIEIETKLPDDELVRFRMHINSEGILDNLYIDRFLE